MSLTIRSLSDSGISTELYVKQLAKWHHEQWLYLNPGASLAERLSRYQQAVQSQTLPHLYIATNETELLGSVTLDKDDMDTRDYLTPWLASLYVKQEARQQGVGSQLIEFCCVQAKQLGYRNLYLFTEDQTQFYRQRGFRLLESVEYRQVEVDLMCRNLNKQETK